jgi:heme/copper-type cytochrome/quinol oxidase subunit 1
MMSDNKKAIWVWIMFGFICFVIGGAVGMSEREQKKYKMNLKCVQGELYEEIKPNFYVKSHLECFEQRSF